MKVFLCSTLLLAGLATGCGSGRVAFRMPASGIAAAVPNDSAASAGPSSLPVAKTSAVLARQRGSRSSFGRTRPGAARGNGRQRPAPGRPACQAAANSGDKQPQATRSATGKPRLLAKPADGNEFIYAILFGAILSLLAFGIVLLVGLSVASLTTVIVGAAGLVLTVPIALLIEKSTYRRRHR